MAVTLAGLLLTAPVAGAWAAPLGAAEATVPRSVWSVRAKGKRYKGGYAPAASRQPAAAADPHGGYSTTSDLCGLCHAVHQANGAYELLRADSPDAPCVYCHTAGSAHSNSVVYDLNPDGIETANGHTIGAGPTIPESSVSQSMETVTLSTVDADGRPISETIKARSYDSNSNILFRLGRHHGQEPAGTGEAGYVKVGPTALSCVSCHDPHDAPDMVWRPREFSADFEDGAFRTQGYKLLRAYPSGSTTGAPNEAGYYDASQAVKVVEDAVRPSRNVSSSQSCETTYSENGVVRTQPLYVLQSIGTDPDLDGSADPSRVNQFALSYWCADCHNLSLGESTKLGRSEFGAKAHTSRSHAAPFVGAGLGAGQCYSCHRDDLAPRMGETDPPGYGQGVTHAQALRPALGECTRCHYGTGDYAAEQAAAGFRSDFPHSGKTSDIKLLGSYTNVADGSDQGSLASMYAAVTEQNLDAVCLRCHPGVGVHQ